MWFNKDRHFASMISALTELFSVDAAAQYRWFTIDGDHSCKIPLVASLLVAALSAFFRPDRVRGKVTLVWYNCSITRQLNFSNFWPPLVAIWGCKAQCVTTVLFVLLQLYYQIAYGSIISQEPLTLDYTYNNYYFVEVQVTVKSTAILPPLDWFFNQSWNALIPKVFANTDL